MLNYGDAVAHLHIARRVFDSRTPRFTQLGSVWLPLPHILLIPFVQNYQWWATGLAGVIPSALAYLASCVGIYRLARHWMSPRCGRGRAGIFRFQSQLALHANHRHDRAAVSLRSDLDRALDGGVAFLSGRRSNQGNAPATPHCSGPHRGHLHALRRLDHCAARVDAALVSHCCGAHSVASADASIRWPSGCRALRFSLRPSHGSSTTP